MCFEPFYKNLDTDKYQAGSKDVVVKIFKVDKLSLTATDQDSTELRVVIWVSPLNILDNYWYTVKYNVTLKSKYGELSLLSARHQQV